MIFCEGAHFVIIPTALRLIYGKSASSVYGVIFTFTGLANLMIMLICRSNFGLDYGKVFILSAAMNVVAIILLLGGFKQKAIHLTREKEASTHIQ